MAILLSIETAAKGCSTALHENGKLLAAEELHIPQATAARLAVMIRNLFTYTSLSLPEIDGVVVSKGPGSYTGLRIGVATAKGICLALDKPLLAINTLELLAYEAIFKMAVDGHLHYCPMLDARRMEVYCMVLDENRHVVSPTEAKVVDQDSFQDLLAGHRVCFFGDGAAKCAEVIQHPNAVFMNDIHPTAWRLGEMGYTAWLSGARENLVTFEPFYLKDFLIRKPTSLV